jgi:hypothetical protein
MIDGAWMIIFLVMYKAHERAGYQPLLAFKDKKKAESIIDNASIGAAIGYPPYIIDEIELRE